MWMQRFFDMTHMRTKHNMAVFMKVNIVKRVVAHVFIILS